METHIERRRQDEINTVAEQAAAWLLELEAGGPQVEEAFRGWLAESPLHVEAFLWASSMDELLSQADPKRELEIEPRPESLAGPNVVPFDPPPAMAEAGEVTEARFRWRWAAAAAILATAIASLWSLGTPSGGRDYATDIGEQRSVQLADGSKVYLNTGTQLEFRVSAKAREARLVSGEALFDVRQDPSRPFRVLTDGAVIQALGTQFNVYRHGASTTVTVLEGKVRISSDARPEANTFAAGQQASVSPAGKIVRNARADATKATAWRQRRLLFSNDTLEEIATEFNRYNEAPQIRVEGEAARSRRYAAGFDADDPESLLLFLAKDPTLEVQRTADALIIRPR